MWSICEGNEKHIHNVRKPEGKQLLGRTRHGWMMLQFMDGADWILTTLGSAQRWVCFEYVLNPLVMQKMDYFLIE